MLSLMEPQLVRLSHLSMFLRTPAFNKLGLARVMLMTPLVLLAQL